MAEYKLVMPKMGESIIEATVLSWHKKIGDTVAENEILLEVATDKVDSDVPSPVHGTIKTIFFEAEDVVAIGDVLAIIETDKIENAKIQIPNDSSTPEIQQEVIKDNELPESESPQIGAEQEGHQNSSIALEQSKEENIQEEQVDSVRFSPLVLNLAKQENISLEELNKIQGTGLNGRVTKEDILNYIKDKGIANQEPSTPYIKPLIPIHQPPTINLKDSTQGSKVVEMDRIRKLIAKHMIESKHIAAHVSSFVECDVTKIVRWREKHKGSFKEKYGFNLTYLPVFVEAIAQTIKEFPNINISVSGESIIYKKQINIGVATALPSANLIVPVIKNADRKNILGIAQEINNLANKARTNMLTSEDISDGTYSVSNIGTFGNIMGTPIISQPQVAIMAVGAVTKKPVVVEINGEEVIAIRSMMYLSHTYDHRVVDGMLGGQFVKRVATILENFDDEQIL